jgi:hypothetical protein
MMELESAYNAAPHLYILLTYIDKEGAIDRELREKLRQLSLLCALLRSELEKIEKEADMIRKRRWG